MVNGGCRSVALLMDKKARVSRMHLFMDTIREYCEHLAIKLELRYTNIILILYCSTNCHNGIVLPLQGKIRGCDDADKILGGGRPSNVHYALPTVDPFPHYRPSISEASPKGANK